VLPFDLAQEDADEEDEEEEEMAHSINAMLNGAHAEDVIVVGEDIVGHDLLTCISEENLFDKVEVVDATPSPFVTVRESQSHPDLVALAELPSSSLSGQRGPLGRQRTWHHLRPTHSSSAAAACAGNARWPAQHGPHINSFV